MDIDLLVDPAEGTKTAYTAERQRERHVIVASPACTSSTQQAGEKSRRFCNRIFQNASFDMQWLILDTISSFVKFLLPVKNFTRILMFVWFGNRLSMPVFNWALQTLSVCKAASWSTPWEWVVTLVKVLIASGTRRGAQVWDWLGMSCTYGWWWDVVTGEDLEDLFSSSQKEEL